MYPNPINFSQNLTVNTTLDEAYQIEIANLLGRVLISEKGTQLNTINLSDLIRGTYFVNFVTDNQRYARKLVIR